MLIEVIKNVFDRPLPMVSIRKFEPPYLLNKEGHNEYVNKGFTIIPQLLSETQVLHMRDAFTFLSGMSGYEQSKSFINSGRFASTSIREFVMNTICEMAKLVLPAHINLDVCSMDTGGAFQIKPFGKESALNPHQDSPVVDERFQYASFVWVALQDVHEDNGCLWMLPGSHLWGNHQRSLNVPWVFESNTRLIWRHLLPVPIKSGDAIVFDAAIIHGSRPNLLAGSTRLAFTTSLLPLTYSLVDYFLDSKSATKKVDRYHVDKEYWTREDFMKRPPTRYPLVESEELIYPDKLRDRAVKKLIKHYWPA